jgi:transposase InsO family protein
VDLTARRELIGEVFEYIEAFNNPIRRQSTLGRHSPAQFEQRRVTQIRGTSTAITT